MEEAGVEKLLEVADHPQVDQLLDVIGVALTQLLAVQPGGGEDPAGRQLVEGAGDHHLHWQAALGELQCPFSGFDVPKLSSVNNVQAGYK